MIVETDYVIPNSYASWLAQNLCVSSLASEKQNQNQKLQVVATNSDWFIVLFAPIVIVRSDHFGVGFLTVVLKPL